MTTHSPHHIILFWSSTLPVTFEFMESTSTPAGRSSPPKRRRKRKLIKRYRSAFLRERPSHSEKAQKRLLFFPTLTRSDRPRCTDASWEKILEEVALSEPTPEQTARLDCIELEMIDLDFELDHPESS
jgi:hypothetical protein